MYLDIGICIMLLIFAFMGWRTGFMRGLFGLLSSIIGFVAVIFLAGPLAELIGSWFELQKYIRLIISALFIYFIVWLVFFILSKVAKKIKNASKIADKTDKVLGIFMGLAKGILSIAMLFVTIYLVSNIPYISDGVDWLFKNSVIGTFIYDLTVKMLVPLFGSLEASILGAL